MKSYHITWDTQGDDDLEIIKKTLCVQTSKPYLFVHEYGVTGKSHYHGYFTSQYSKNTVKNKIQEGLKTSVYFTNPEHPKYLKYSQDGVLGVEIYLVKGETNHMKPNDDLKVMPLIIWSNNSYYSILPEGGRMAHIRKVYENVITKMKNYKTEVSKISKEKTLTEWQLILKDLQEMAIDTDSQIKDYLAYTHYTREKYNFTENGFRNLYRKIKKNKNINNYKNYIRNIMDVMTQ